MVLSEIACEDDVIKMKDFGGTSQELCVDMQGSQHKWRGFFFLVFPMMPLGSLLKLLLKANSVQEILSNETRRYLCASFVRNLSQLTNHGLAHGDMKPDNIVLTQDENGVIGTALIDLGSAGASHLPVSWSVGTINYEAPEAYPYYPGSRLAHKAKPFCPKKMDVFNVGTTIFTTLF